jgi:hypothetical protein
MTWVWCRDEFFYDKRRLLNLMRVSSETWNLGIVFRWIGIVVASQRWRFVWVSS